MDIEFRIDEFSGPLDLLLHLIKKNKMNILDIEIEKITDQYMEYLEKCNELNLEITSNYLVMASELLYIKSRFLLPRDEEEEDEEEEEDPREELINKLTEYQAYKDITSILKEKYEERSEVYTKIPEDFKNYSDAPAISKGDSSVDLLVQAFQKFLERKNAEKPVKTKVTEKEIKVSERKTRIRSLLKSRKKVKFFDLFEDYSKEYIVATFLAVLELTKEGEVRIKQDSLFGDIECEAI